MYNTSYPFITNRSDRFAVALAVSIRLLLLLGFLNLFLAAPLQADPLAPPVAPSNLSASAVSTSQINLRWQDNSSDEMGFIIERGTSSTGPWSQITTAGANVILYSNTGLSTATYYYRVCAFNSRGNNTYNSSYSSVATASTICTYSISSTSAHPGAAAASGTLTVTANPGGCPWTASSSAPSWLTCTPASGSVTGPVTWYVTANTSTSSRTGTLTIAGRSFTVTQSGAGCTYSISSTSAYPGAAAASGTLTVTANPGCPWTASSSATSWLTCTPASGSGPGSVTWSVTANTSASSRTGTLTIAGRSFTVTQSGGGCNYFISPTSASPTSTGGNGYVNVTTGTNCSWTASSSVWWITAAGSRTGNGTATYLVAANTGASSRTGTLTIAGQTFTVTQAASASSCTYSISPTISPTFPAAGGSSSVSVTASSGCPWTTSNSLPWVTITAVIPGSTNGTVSYLVAANSSTSPRTANLTIAGQPFTVSQAAAASSPPPPPGPWAKSFGGTSSDIGKVAAVDSSGNIVVVGAFLSSAINLGTGPLVNASSGTDLYIAKFTPDGNTCLFSRRLGGTGNETVSSVALDANGNIFVGGSFNGATDLGGGPLTSVGGMDMFVAKYSATGSFQWGKSFGTSGSDVLSSLAVDRRDGNVVFTGKFPGFADGDLTITFGGNTLSQGQTFLVKLSGANGAHIWSKNFGSVSSSQGSGLTIDPNGNIALVGPFNGAIDFTTNMLWSLFYPPPTALLAVRDATGVPTWDFFVAKFSPVGEPLWAKSFGGQGNDAANRVALDASGNMFVSGTFTWKITLGSQTLNAWANSTTDADIFLMKLSPAGDPIWSKSFAGNASEGLSGLAVDNSGNVIGTGSFSYTLNIGGTMLTSATWGSPDGFAAKYSSSGSLAWVKRFGGPGADESNAVAADGSGNAFITGTFSGTADFEGQSLTSAGATDTFLLRVNP